jgi:UDP-glucose 4-epimerase
VRILVTGGAGFIGSNVVDVLLKKQHKVVVLDNLSSGKKEKPQIVIHKAAQIDVHKSVADPFFDAKVNILGSINVLNACVENKAKKIIFASSGGTIYGECGVSAPSEESKANPLSPYGIAKNSAENYIKFYSAAYGLEYTILRYSNVYGPRQDSHGEAGVIAIFAAKMLHNEDINIFGDGKQMRDYVYVFDVANANLKALNKGKNQIINIGTSKAVSINQLVEIMSKTAGYKKKAIHQSKRAGELFKNFLNINKAKKVLDWKSEVSIEKGIKETIEYLKASGK